VAGTFAGWGLPTTEAIRQVRQALPDVALIGSGGIRSGVDVAIALALGANLAATARPALAPAIDERGAEAVIEGLHGYLNELRVAMFCSGCADLHALRALNLGAASA
jgi:isopentenyl-diphosphate delta-isomerase